MGGMGSGRPAGMGRDTVDGCRTLDVNRLHRAGCLRDGWSGGWQWTRDGQRVASIGMAVAHATLILNYRVRTWGGDWEDVRQELCIVRVPCRLGGTRPFLLCPGGANGCACGRRVAKLHTAGRYFLCRRCHGLAYASQSEDRHDRALRRANGIRARLGGETGIAAPFPGRPRGMWRRTYLRLSARAAEAEMEALAGFEARLDRYSMRRTRTRGKGGFWT